MNPELRLDIQKQKYDQLHSIITGRVGDNKSNVVDVYITKDNEPYPLTNRNIFYECLKPDKTTVRDTDGVKMIDAANGHFTYTFPTEVFSYPGNVIRSFFTIEEDKEFRATTQSFPVVSLPNALDGNVPSSHYIPDLEKLIDQANQIIKHIKELEQEATEIIDKELVELRKKADALMKEIKDSADKVIQGIEADFAALKKQVDALQKKVDAMDVVKRSGDAMTGDLDFVIDSATRAIRGTSGGKRQSGIFFDSNGDIGAYDWGNPAGAAGVFKYRRATKTFEVLTPNTNVAKKTEAQMQKITNDAGGQTISISDVKLNILEEIEKKGTGMNTIYCAGGVQGSVPSAKSWRGISFLNSPQYGFIIAFDYNSKLFTNYFDNGKWLGWQEKATIGEVVKKSGDAMSGVLTIETKDSKTCPLYLKNPGGIVRIMPYDGDFNYIQSGTVDSKAKNLLITGMNGSVMDEVQVKTKEFDAGEELSIRGKLQAPTNAAVWYSAEKTKYGNGESVISQKAAPRWASGRTVEMSQNGTYKMQEDGIYDIHGFLSIGPSPQGSQHVLKIQILNSAGQIVDNHEMDVQIVQNSSAYTRLHGSVIWSFKKGEQFRFVYVNSGSQIVERQVSRLSVVRLTHGLEEQNPWQ